MKIILTNLKKYNKQNGQLRSDIKISIMLSLLYISYFYTLYYSNHVYFGYIMLFKQYMNLNN